MRSKHGDSGSGNKHDFFPLANTTVTTLFDIENSESDLTTFLITHLVGLLFFSYFLGTGCLADEIVALVILKYASAYQ